MLRFGTASSRRRRPFFPPQLRGVWMLLVMLGAVMLLMRQVPQPQTATFLGQLFGQPASRQGTTGMDNGAVAISSVSMGEEGPAEREPADAPTLDDALWGPVTDNAVFLRAEQPAWLALITQARDAAKLAQHSLGNVTYAQLMNQPDAYRGRSVQVAGRVLRESPKPAPPNDGGISQLHQLILVPRGGGQWPIVVYALDLPAGFPRGDGLSEPVVADGLFFKNWSFPYDGGMGLAPVIVAPTVAWTSPAAGKGGPTEVASGVTGGVLAGIAAAATASIGFVAWAAVQTRRPRRTYSSTPDLDGVEIES